VQRKTTKDTHYGSANIQVFPSTKGYPITTHSAFSRDMFVLENKTEKNLTIEKNIGHVHCGLFFSLNVPMSPCKTQ
jgi:hypothetical protein